MSLTLELAERLWRGDTDTTAHHPVAPLPIDPEEIADGLFYFKGIAATSVLDTGAGLAMVDTGARNESRALHEAVRRWRPGTPVASAIFTHHHVDHVFGVDPFDRETIERGWPAPRVYAHALVRAHFDRYRRTVGWNTAINVRQFQLPPDRFRWPDTYRYPDVEFHEPTRLTQGGLTFDLRPARGETEDAVWVWVPERRLLFPGDLFIWAIPNAGNPQKVQRYPADWAMALRAMAALGAELMVPGHGLPIAGADRIRTALSETADVLESIETQVLALMNRGAALDEVLHQVRAPAHLIARPYLRPVYDDPQFIARTVWRFYGGWWDGEPDTLLPAPRAEQAREWIALSGGLDRVLARAAALLAEGNARLATHLVEHAVLAEPGSAAAHRLRQQVYEARAKAEPSTMGRNILAHAARASAAGRRD